MKVLGLFPNLKSAQEAFKILREEGISKAYVDVNTTNKDIINSFPGTSFRTSVSEPMSNSPTFFNTTSLEENQIDGTVNNVNYSYTLVVETDETQVDYIKNIINKMGGVIQEEPNSNELK